MLDIIPPNVAWYILVGLNIFSIMYYLTRIANHDAVTSKPPKHESVGSILFGIVIMLLMWFIYMPLKP